VVGILTRDRLLHALAREGKGLPVSEVMQRDFQTVEASEMLETGFRRLQDCQCRTLPVTRNGRLAGLVTMENLGEFMMIQSALKVSQKNR
jgi:CBS-domain-containing membrane protein